MIQKGLKKFKISPTKKNFKLNPCLTLPPFNIYIDLASPDQH